MSASADDLNVTMPRGRRSMSGSSAEMISSMADGPPLDQSLQATIGRKRRGGASSSQLSPHTGGPSSGDLVSTRTGGRTSGRQLVPTQGRANMSDTQEILADGSVSGEVGFSKYVLGDEIGRGGLGVVRRADDKQLKRRLAMKVLLDTRNEANRQEFIEEAQITGQLEHPNIIPVHELGHDPMGRPYMAMKLVKGHNLQELIQHAHKRGRTSRLHDLQRERLLETFMKVCDAISYAHARGVIHRDLKPENVMVGEFGEVLVMDWGLAKPLGQPERLSLNKDAVATDRRAASPMLTMQGEVFGTPGYMSPEQANGRIDEVDERCDVFGLGTILYEILTHQPPYVGKTVDQVLERAAAGRVIPPRRRAPKMQVPKELDAIAMKALEKDPRRRYRSAEDLRRDIEAWLGNDTVVAYPDSMFEKMSKWARRNPTRAMVGSMGALFVVITLAAVFVALTAEQGRREAQEQRQVAESERQKAEDAAVALEESNQKLVAAQDKVKQNAEMLIAEAKRREAVERELREAAEEAAAVAELARSGELEKLRQRLGISERKDQVVKEFRQKFDAFVAQGRNYIEFFQQMTKEQVEGYIKAFEDLIAASKEDGQRYYDDVDMANLGQLYTGAALFGNGREMNINAITAYDKAIEINPGRADYYVRKAGCEVNIGRQREAIESCNMALQLNPQQLDALFSRGLAYWYTKEHDKGIADFETALRLQPALADFRIRLYDMLCKVNRKAEADKMLREGLTYSPNHHNLLLFIGQVAMQDGNFDEAIQVLGRLYQIAPTDFAAAAMYGSALLNAQRPADAIPPLQAATRAQGATWEAWKLLGIAQANTNDPQGAISNLQEAWRRAPNANAKAELEGLLQQLGARPQ